jgi:hypothetical protein
MCEAFWEIAIAILRVTKSRVHVTGNRTKSQKGFGFGVLKHGEHR